MQFKKILNCAYFQAIPNGLDGSVQPSFIVFIFLSNISNRLIYVTLYIFILLFIKSLLEENLYK